MNAGLIVGAELFCTCWGGLVGHLITKRHYTKRAKATVLPDQWVTTTLMWESPEGRTITNSFAGNFWGYESQEELYWAVMESCTGLKPELKDWTYTVLNYQPRDAMPHGRNCARKGDDNNAAQDPEWEIHTLLGE